MADIAFNLEDLFEQTFGYKSQAFQPEFSEYGGRSPAQRLEQGAHGSPYYTKDELGTEYYMPVTLTYQEEGLADNGAGAYKKWNLPYPVVSISSRKTIVETPLTERRGTVKELINIQDYEITIRGFIIGKPNEFPESDVTLLRTIYEQNTPISIQCPITDIFLVRPERNGSDEVVISDLKFPSIQGVKNVRPYELHLISDEAFNLLTIN